MAAFVNSDAELGISWNKTPSKLLKRFDNGRYRMHKHLRVLSAKTDPAIEEVVPHLEHLAVPAQSLRTLADRRLPLRLTLGPVVQHSRGFTFANHYADENLSRMRDALSTSVTSLVHHGSPVVPWYTTVADAVVEQAQVDVAVFIPHLSVLRGLPQNPDRLSNVRQGL